MVAALFAGGSVLVLLAKEEDEADPPTTDPAVADQRPVPSPSPRRRLPGRVGDITQITTANLTARYHDPRVGTGALLALWSVTALALTVGRGLQRLPTRLVRRFTAVALALAVGTLVEALRA